MLMQGEKVYLKEGFAEENYPLLLNWFHDLEVMGYIGWVKRGLALENVEQLKSFIAELEGGIIFTINDKEDNFIGYTSLCDFKGKEECEFGIFILDKTYWGKGIGMEVTRLMLRHAFEGLKMQKVVLSTSELHKNAIRLYEKCGFVMEKVIPNDRTILHGGKWVSCGTVEMKIEQRK